MCWAPRALLEEDPAALDEASAAWLDSALVRAEPVGVVVKVVDPTVVVKVEEPLTPVETRAAVPVLWGTEVAPAMPEMPLMTVEPVTRLVLPSVPVTVLV